MNKRDQSAFNEIVQSSCEWLTVKQVARLLTVHPDTVRRWAAKGYLKAKRHPFNNYRLFLADELQGINEL